MSLRLALVLVFGCAATLPAWPQAAKPAAVTAAMPTPDERARQWLTLVDDGNYAQTWSEAGAAFRAGRSSRTWADNGAAMRGPPGAMASRDLKSIDLSRADVAVVRYDSVFAHKAAAVETVTLVFEKGGWAVTDYSIR